MKPMNIRKFAEITDTSVDTLKYYDKIDLIKPAEVNPDTGYRYYEMGQVQILELIKYLRSMDVSIPQIKKYLNNQSLDTTLNLLEESIEQVNSKIQRLTYQKNAMLRRTHYLKVAKFALEKPNTIELTRFKRRYYYSSGNVDTTLEEYCYTVTGMKKALSDNRGIMAFLQGGFIIPKEYIRSGFGGNLLSFIFVSDQEYHGFGSDIEQVMEGYFVCGYHKGSVLDRDDLLEKMTKHIDDKKYEICGDALQVCLSDEDVTSEKKDFMYQIQIPVMI